MSTRGETVRAARSAPVRVEVGAAVVIKVAMLCTPLSDQFWIEIFFGVASGARASWTRRMPLV